MNSVCFLYSIFLSDRGGLLNVNERNNLIPIFEVPMDLDRRVSKRVFGFALSFGFTVGHCIRLLVLIRDKRDDESKKPWAVFINVVCLHFIQWADSQLIGTSG